MVAEALTVAEAVVFMVGAAEAVSTAAALAADRMLRLAVDNTTPRQNRMAAVTVPTGDRLGGLEVRRRAVQEWVFIPAHAPGRAGQMARALKEQRDHPHVRR